LTVLKRTKNIFHFSFDIFHLSLKPKSGGRQAEITMPGEVGRFQCRLSLCNDN